MTDSTVATPRIIDDQGTPLAEFRRSQSGSAPRDSTSDEDVLKQLSALSQGVGALDLGSMAYISVTGADRFRWLNGMVTNSIHTLDEGQGNYNFVLNAQGRIQGDGYIFRQGEQLLIETSREQLPKLIEHLDRFIIMDDVELKPVTGITALGVVGPGAADLLRRISVQQVDIEPLTLTQIEVANVDATLVRSYEVQSPRYELLFEQQHVGAVWQALLDGGATPCGTYAAEALRILEGIPAYGIDLRDRDLPQETGQVRALNFSKGCYLGQEIVERIRSRGNVHRMFTRLELTGTVPITPADLNVDGKVVGQITSAAKIITPASTRIVALGFLRGEIISAQLASQGRIEYDGGFARPISSTPAMN
jgi:folate-binding protein YgfZ